MSAPVLARLVEPGDADATLAELIADALPAVPTAELRRALAAGQVWVEGAPAGAERPLAAGERVEVHGPLGAVRPARLAGLEVLHRGEAVWVVSKPAGVLSQPARGEDPATTRSAPGCSTRSGCARRPPSRRRPRARAWPTASTATPRGRWRSRSPAPRCARSPTRFTGRQITKEYLALVRGAPREAEGVVELALRLPTPGTRARRVEVAAAGAEGARSARTRWALVERLGRYSLLRAWPETGRQHQVRVHLAALGLPLVADPLYGDGAPLLLSSFKRGYRPGKGPERPLIARAALHAARLTFDVRHALPDEPPVDAEAPLPPTSPSPSSSCASSAESPERAGADAPGIGPRRPAFPVGNRSIGRPPRELERCFSESDSGGLSRARPRLAARISAPSALSALPS